MSDIYDSAFRTILNDCRQLILPVINEAFGERYRGDEEVDFSPNEHFIDQQDEADRKVITDTNFVVRSERGEKRYHWECQSTADSRMLVRLFEYDAQIALDAACGGSETLTVEFPHSAVLYLRSTGNTPARYRYVIKTPGGEMQYDIPVMKIQSYSLDEIFERRLFLLLPFYIFTFEADFAEYEADATRLSQLRAEYQRIADRLEALTKSGELNDFERVTIQELADDVMKALARKYERLLSGMEGIMRGPLIETKARKFRNEGVEWGLQRGLQQGLQRGLQQSRTETVRNLLAMQLLTDEQIAQSVGLTVAELKALKATL